MTFTTQDHVVAICAALALAWVLWRVTRRTPGPMKIREGRPMTCLTAPALYRFGQCTDGQAGLVTGARARTR